MALLRTIRLSPKHRPILRRSSAASYATSRAAITLIGLVGLVTGCGVQVYDWGDGGSGTQFHVPAEAALNKSPIVQSWIAYSLAKSTCQLQIGGDLPAQNSSFKCELRPREVLVRRWATRNEIKTDPSATDSEAAPPPSSLEIEQDEYLDLLVRVEEAGFLEEYVWYFFQKRDWPQPEWLELHDFESWRGEHLPWHRPQTRLIGYWITPKSDTSEQS